MVEVIGDVVEPSMFRLPTTVDGVDISGAGLVMLSGAKIWFHNGTGFELVASVAG